MADANRVNLRYDKETVWGVLDSGPPKFVDIRFTSESLKGTKETETSGEIRGDRQVANVIRTGIGAEGDINFEYSYGSYDEFFQALYMSAGWSTLKTSTASTYSMAIGDNSINDSGSGFVTAGYVAKQWVRISGFTEAANNGYFKLESVVAAKMVLSGGTVATESAGDSVTVLMGSQIANGTTEASYSIEREHEDIASTFELYLGMMISTMTLNFPVSGVITGTFSFMGAQEQAKTATSGDGSPTAVSETLVQSAANDIVKVLIDGTSVCLMGGSITFENGIRLNRCAGSVAPDSPGIGRFMVSGDLELQFSGNTQRTKALAHTEINIAIVFEDAAGNGNVLEIPACQITDDETVAGGADTELIEKISFEAFMDSSEDITAKFARFAA